ncbi:MAG TPA: ATPase domain-containing protein [Nitrososphaeraceae archaeon]|nr:ATPase domain-containing protein [Nitrososphaeraceae archaeon]
MLERISTGVPGLDSLIEGGIPKGSTVMIAGKSGSGKTILSSQFVYYGLTDKNENGLYISFSESKAQFYANMKTLGMDFDKFERQGKFTFLDFASLTKDGIQDTLEEILATIRTTNTKRLILDSFSAISLAFEHQSEARNAIHVLLGKIMRSEGITSLLIMEIPHGSEKMGYGIEESVVDGIIQLEHTEDNTLPITLRVFKMRGTAINREPHVCTIIRNGMILYPKQSLRPTFAASEDRILSGIPGLDERIGNGFIRGTTSAIMGPTGTAKSTFAFQYVVEGVKKGEAGIFYSLEDSADGIRMMAKGYGYNITELENNGLSIVVGSPWDESPDALIASLAASIERTKAKRLVIDGLSVFENKYKNDMHMIAKRFISLIQHYKITALITILTTQKSGFEISELGVSSLLQNIILLRYVEVQGRLKRILLVLKMRGTQHDESILEFRISKDNGVEIVGPIGSDYVGIFTGVAQRIG